MELFALKQKPEYLDQVAEWLYLEWGMKTADSSLLTVHEKLKTFKNINKIPINYVAVKGDKLVGTFSLMLFDPPARRDLSPWLGSLYVEPTCRNHGIGTFLVDYAVAAARSFKIKKLYLCTSTQEQMYAKLGWKPIDEVRFRDERVTILEICT